MDRYHYATEVQIGPRSWRTIDTGTIEARNTTEAAELVAMDIEPHPVEENWRVLIGTDERPSTILLRYTVAQLER